MDISQIVNVNITRQTPGVQQAGFGRALILGSTQAFSERFRLYTGTAGMLSDGFVTSDPEYIAAAEYFAQDPAPNDVLVGRRLAPVAMVKNVQIVTFTNAHDYIINVDGTPVNYLSDGSATAAEIRDGLISFINATFGQLTAAAVDGTNLSITANNAGEPIVCTTDDAAMAITTTTANQGVPEDLAVISATNALGNSWYGLVLTSRALWNQKAAADYIESTPMKFAGFGSAEADALTSSDTGIGIYLKSNSYDKSFAFWNGEAAAKYPEVAIMGKEFPNVPGSSQWALKSLSGIVADALSDTQIANLKTNNYMFYTTIGGLDVTLEGKVGSGEWIDVIIGIDWMTARIAEAVFGALVDAPKIPFTDPGITVIGNQITSVLKQAEQNGLLGAIEGTPAFSVNMPLASSYTSAQRATRILSGVPFSGHLAGAIIYAEINGNVTN